MNATAEKKVKEPSLTNILVGVTDEHIAKMKGRSAEIAKLLKEGMSKSEVLGKMQADEAANGLAEGMKPITHQVIYQVYKRLMCMEGVTIGQKELVTNRVKKAATAEAPAEEAPKTASAEFAAAGAEDTGVVEG